MSPENQENKPGPDPMRSLEQRLDLTKQSLVRPELPQELREKMERTIAELQEALDYLRLSVKYLTFDLEATRRENEGLRAENKELRRKLTGEDGEG